jgi:hypothetical protein
LYRSEVRPDINGFTFVLGLLSARYKSFVPGEEKVRYTCEAICSKVSSHPV